MKTRTHVTSRARLALALILAIQAPLACLADSESENVPGTQAQQPRNSGKLQLADVLSTVLQQAPEVIRLIRESKQKPARPQPQPAASQAAVLGNPGVLEQIQPEAAPQLEEPAVQPVTTAGDSPATPDVQSLVAEVVRAQTVAALETAVQQLITTVPDPAQASRAIRLAANDFPEATAEQKRVIIAVFDQLMKECKRPGVHQAVILCAIRTLAFQAVAAADASQIQTLLSSRDEDLKAEVTDAAVAQALAAPAGLFRSQLVPRLKALFHDWTTAGAQVAAQRVEQAQNGATGRSTAGASAGLVGRWRAGILGEAAGMAHELYFTFNADGTCIRSSQSTYDFGAAGGAHAATRPAAAKWSLAGKTLRVEQPDGKALVFQIASSDGRNMITKRTNGDRWLWEKQN